MSISPSYALLLPRRATPRLLLASLPLLLLAWAAARQLDLYWARWLFHWTTPLLPEGWHGVNATDDSPGSTVIVRE